MPPGGSAPKTAGPGLLPAGSVVVVALFAFAGLAADLMTGGPLTRMDIPISQWFHVHNNVHFTQAMGLVSALHGTSAICAMAAVAAALLAWARQYRWLLALVVSVPGGLVLNALVKHAFERTRPVFDDVPAAIHTYSFPSGHTAGATVWWGFLLLIWCGFTPRPALRLSGIVVAVLLVALTALSRVVLGAHFPTDVVAGVAEGVAWLAGAWLLARPAHPVQAKEGGPS